MGQRQGETPLTEGRKVKVIIVSATPNPMEVASTAAGLCYGKIDYSPKRVRNCVRMGHTSIIEHCVVTFIVSGISRSCSHQLVRHRIASYNQESQRYCKYDFKSDDWYVTPPEFEGNERFKNKMHQDAMLYLGALHMGVKPEDARYQLPEAMKTKIIVTMNARSLFNFLDLRTDKAAQWEIRELAEEVERQVSGINGQWEELLSLRKEGND